MNKGIRGAFWGAVRAALASVVCAAGLSAQTAQQEKPPMADDAFKDIQVLRGLTVDQFMGTMGFFSASLGLNCSRGLPNNNLRQNELLTYASGPPGSFHKPGGIVLPPLRVTPPPGPGKLTD